MDYGLNGKRVLVTGSTGGLGSVMAQYFAAEGARVVVHGRDEVRAQATMAALKAAGAEASLVLGDLAHDDSATEVARQALDAFGGIDILVNNAGGVGAMTKAWLDVEPAEWLDMYSSDVVSAVRMVRALIPGMCERGWGRIVQISTAAAIKPFPMGPQYSSAKSALATATVSLASTVGRFGVTVNTVIPGAIHTPAIEGYWRAMAPERNWGESWAEIEQNAVREFTPNMLGKLGRPDHIAAAVLFLASEGAAYITGSSIRVDGGAIATV